MGKDANLTEKEREYIRAMFLPDYPEVRKITKASQLGDFAGLFIENKDDEDGGPLDVSITKKFFTYHNIPLNTTYGEYNRKYAHKVA